MARRQDGVSAPDTCAGRMATFARMTLGPESLACDAESYQRGPWRRPDPRLSRPAPHISLIQPPRSRPHQTLQCGRASSPLGRTRDDNQLCGSRASLTRLLFGTPLEPLAKKSRRRAESRYKKALHDSGFFGGRTRARTWDPLIKSQLLRAIERVGPIYLATAWRGFTTWTVPPQGHTTKNRQIYLYT